MHVWVIQETIICRKQFLCAIFRNPAEDFCEYFNQKSHVCEAFLRLLFQVSVGPLRQLVPWLLLHKSKEKSLVTTRKTVTSPWQRRQNLIGKKHAQEEVKSDGRCYSFSDSTVIAKWQYGSYPQGGGTIEAWCVVFFVRKKDVSLFKEWIERKTRKIVEMVWNIFVLKKCFVFLEMEKIHG